MSDNKNIIEAIFVNRDLNTPLSYNYGVCEYKPDNIRALSAKNFALCAQRHPDLPKKVYLTQEKHPKNFVDLGCLKTENKPIYLLVKLEGMAFSHHEKFTEKHYSEWQEKKLFSGIDKKQKKNMAAVIRFEEVAAAKEDDKEGMPYENTRAIIGLYMKL